MLRRAASTASRLSARSLRLPSVSASSSRAASTFAAFNTPADAPLLANLKNNVLTVTFNRPQSFNSMTADMGEQLISIMDAVTVSFNTDVAPEDKVKVVVFTGAGKAFSSGGDADFLYARCSDKEVGNMLGMDLFYRRFLAQRAIPAPTIAAINGPCVGAGACFAAACDLRVMADDAYIGFVFAKLGLHPGLGATHFLPKIVGPAVANKLLLTGDMVSPEEALRVGLVSDVVPRASLEASVDELAQKLVKNDSVAQFTLLRTLRGQQNTGLAEALVREADAQAHCYHDPMLQKRVYAINHKEKRQRE